MKRPNILLNSIFLLFILALTGCQPQATISQIQSLPVNQPVGNKNGWQIFTCSENINDLLAEGDVLWEATEGGVVRWEPKTNITWKYTTLDGLASNDVSCLFKDDVGNFWFGTDRGLSRYDGSVWCTFTTEDGLAVNKITSIAQDKEGNLWVAYDWELPPDGDVGYSSGVCRYDGVNWQTFTRKDGLVSDYAYTIFCDIQGNTWFGTDIGLSKYDGSTWHTFTTEDGLPSNHVSAISQDKQGNIWIGSGNGVSRYDGNNWHTFGESDGLGNNVVADIAVDSQGRLWFSHGHYGISRYDGKSWQNFTKNDGLPTDYVVEITPDYNGNIWFSIYKRESTNFLHTTGIGYYDGKFWQSYPYSGGLTSNTISAIAVDETGNIWCGLGSGFGGEGAWYYNGADWHTFTTGDGLPSNYVYDIIPDKRGKLWFNFGSTISQYDGSHWISITASGGSIDGYISAFSRDSEGNLWLVNDTEVAWYDGINWHTLMGIDDLPRKDIKLVTHDIRGNVWLVDEKNGLWQFDGTGWHSIDWQMISPLPKNATVSIDSIASDNKGNVWIGTSVDPHTRTSPRAYTYDLRWFDGKTWNITYFNGRVNSIFQDNDGNLWFCKGSGLTRYNGTIWRTFIPKDEIAYGGVRAIAESDGIYWIATTGGISRFDSKSRE